MSDQLKEPDSSALLGRNPIFIEYYSHAKCDCYKIKLPWPRYAEEKLVLCEVSEGIEHARVVACEALGTHIAEAIARPNAGTRQPSDEEE